MADYQDMSSSQAMEMMMFRVLAAYDAARLDPVDEQSSSGDASEVEYLASEASSDDEQSNAGASSSGNDDSGSEASSDDEQSDSGASSEEETFSHWSCDCGACGASPTPTDALEGDMVVGRSPGSETVLPTPQEPTPRIGLAMLAGGRADRRQMSQSSLQELQAVTINTPQRVAHERVQRYRAAWRQRACAILTRRDSAVGLGQTALQRLAYIRSQSEINWRAIARISQVLAMARRRVDMSNSDWGSMIERNNRVAENSGQLVDSSHDTGDDSSEQSGDDD
ncbi:hypothetical protein LTR17_015156 [Elasticomyces elasticus]|nr:hypothetical protein LTR17_015156 [Elasticomyces elasticus]